MEHFDVAIAGAGPAGATLAYLLARSGVRVALVERERQLDREFRGPGYQPAVVRLWEEMGVADLILELDHAKFDTFRFGSKAELKLPGDVVLMHQGPLLRRLIQLAAQFPHFRYFGGTLFEEWEGGADLTVAADGRSSQLRQTHGIELEPVRQQFDVLWFEIPQQGRPDVGFLMGKRSLVVRLPQEGNRLQVGWILPKGGYRALQQRGFAAFKREVESLLGEKVPLTGWEQCALLDVKIAMAKEWHRAGPLLIGDAAHIASPVGAIGNKLAIEDAVLAHRLIMENRVHEFEKLRRPDIAKQLKLQRWFGRILFRAPWLLRFVRPDPTPLAFSPHPLHVATEHFKAGGRNYSLLRVAQITQETPDARSIHFEGSFPFQPGQFLTLRVLREGRLRTRCYSLSSATDLQITVKRQEGGAVSPYLSDELKVGDRLLVLPPAGEFVATDTDHYAFLAGGSGITPIMGLIEELHTRAKIRLFYVTREEVIFKEKLDALDIDVTYWITPQRGRPTAADLKAFFDQGGEPYLCGPESLRALAKQTLSRPFHEEVFLSAQEELAPPAPHPTGEPPEHVTVQLHGETTTIAIGPDQTILDAALRAGLDAPFSCQEGICATCRAKLLKGKVYMEKHQALTDQEIADQYVLTCQAKPLTKDSSVDYD